MKKTSFLVALTLLFAVAANAQNKARNIQFNLTKGETYSQVQNTSIQIHQELAGQNIDMNMKMVAATDYTVLESSGNNYTLKVQFKKLVMSLDNPMVQINIDTDSEEPADNEFSELMQKLMKHLTTGSFTMVMDRTGNVSDVKGVDKLYAGMMESIADEYPEVSDEVRTAALEQVKQAYGEQSFKGSFEMVLKLFPDKKVKVNDTWMNEVNIQSGMEAYYLVKYTFAEETDEYLAVNGKGVFKTADKDAYTKVNGMDARYDLKGTYHAEYKVDPNTGWILKATINNEAGGDVIIMPGDRLPDGMTVPMKISGHTELNP